MTESEKEKNPTYVTTWGFLKVYDYREAFQKSYNQATREDQLRIKECPNFDADKFLLIAGIRVDDEVVYKWHKWQKIEVTMPDGTKCTAEIIS